MTIFEWVSLILNILFGSGLYLSLLTLKSVKKEAGAKAEKAAAEARADELKNVESAIKIWRTLAEDITSKHEDMIAKCEVLSDRVEKLTNEVNRLRLTNNRIVKLLDRITHENLENVVAEIKQELDK